MRDPIYRHRPVEPNPARFGGERINDFIILSEAFSNAYLIETPEGNIQINSGMGMEAPVIDANFRAFNIGITHSLILTQGHVDHVGGVAFFREKSPGLRLIAGANNPEHQAYDARIAPFRGSRSAFAFADKFADVFAYYQAEGHTDYPPQDTPVPDLLVEDKYAFELGGLAVEVIALPGAETNDSVIVWLPQHRICFTGNLFGCPFGHIPNLVTIRGDRYRDALVVANAVDVVRQLEPEMICYGHHDPVVGSEIIREELTVLHDAIFCIHDETVKGMNEGKDVHTLMAEITLPPELEVGEGYGKVPWNVRAIWENYAGWFHHQSTTELYAIPRSAVAGDLLELAGGAEALVRRATEKFEHGEREAALHLLDIVWDAGADTDESRSLGIRIHESLLADSTNFWLTAWLKNRITFLRENCDQ